MKNEERITNDIEIIGAICLAFVVVFLFSAWPDVVGSQIGDYPARRLANGTLMPLNRTIYKVKPLMDTIIYWMPGIDETPRKLVNCAVRDRKNWVGYYPDGSCTVVMRKGRIVKDDPNEIHVGRCHWWLLQFEIIKK